MYDCVVYTLWITEYWISHFPPKTRLSTATSHEAPRPQSRLGTLSPSCERVMKKIVVEKEEIVTMVSELVITVTDNVCSDEVSK